MTPAQSPGPQPMSPASNSNSASCNFLPSASTAGALGPCSLRNVLCLTSANTGSCMCDPVQLSAHVKALRHEVVKLRGKLQLAEKDQTEKMATLEKDEREQREQNIRLRRKLQMEIERRERLCRHLRYVLFCNGSNSFAHFCL